MKRQIKEAKKRAEYVNAGYTARRLTPSMVEYFFDLLKEMKKISKKYDLDLTQGELRVDGGSIPSSYRWPATTTSIELFGGSKWALGRSQAQPRAHGAPADVARLRVPKTHPHYAKIMKKHPQHMHGGFFYFLKGGQPVR